MSGQIAKLFIRGSLMNVTAKNLTEEQKVEVETLMNLAWNDTKLDNSKHEFCNALARTIGNEYYDKEVAMMEAKITFWRTAVDVLYHNPKPIVATNSLIRHKHFKTCMFNYLRQILAENKIPSHRQDYDIVGEADYVATEVLSYYFSNLLSKSLDWSILKLESNETIFNIDTNLIPIDVMNKIWDLRDEFNKHGISILITDRKIHITPSDNMKFVTKKLSEKVKISEISLTGPSWDEEKDNFYQFCESKSKDAKEEPLMDSLSHHDTISTLQSRLPETSRKVFDILIDPPADFIQTFYPSRKTEVRPKAAHIAEYLGISKAEAESAIQIIQGQAMALDIGVEV